MYLYIMHTHTHTQTIIPTCVRNNSEKYYHYEQNCFIDNHEQYVIILFLMS